MRIRDEPGYYELICDPGPAGLMLATMIAEQAENPFWFVSIPMIDDVRAALGSLSRWPTYAVDHVKVVFGTIQECKAQFDLVVICDLTTLLPDHSASNHIARSIQRAIAGWEPQMPVLVLNQYRYPAPPGGVYWRTRRRSRRLRTLHDDQGFTLAHLQDSGGRFVMKGPGRPTEFGTAGEEGAQLIQDLKLGERIDNRWLIV